MTGRRVVVVGAGGRMGRLAVRLVEASADLVLAAEVGRGDDLDRALAESGAELGIDLTRAGLGAQHARRMIAAGVRPVVGTSGVDAREVRELDALARERGIGGIVVPNLSLGACLLARACELVAARFPSAEIVEIHHPGKADSPSATALDAARRIARARAVARAPKPPATDGASGDPTPAPGPGRELSVEGVPVHSLRLPGHLAHHEVVFGAPGERLTLRHDVSDREAFAPGIRLALAHAARAVGVAHGLEAALLPDPGADAR